MTCFRTNNIRYRRNEILTGDPLLVSLSIVNPPDCISTNCVKNFTSEVINTIAYTYQYIELPMTFTNGQSINVQLKFSSDQQSAKGKTLTLNRFSLDKDKHILLYHFFSLNIVYMEEQVIMRRKIAADAARSVSQGSRDNSVDEPDQQHQKHKRQAADATTTATSITDEDSGTSSLIDLPEPIFFPEGVGNFQLALQSDTSIVIVIGNDYNMYLSNQTSSGTSPANFVFVDLKVSDEIASAMIRDTLTQRYLHSYSDVQENGYSRIRTHLDTHMPCSANIMFWTFENDYLQFFRGGNWLYDTAGCLDPLTGLVKIWIINGAQGLTALQAANGKCGLARLIPINYD